MANVERANRDLGERARLGLGTDTQDADPVDLGFEDVDEDQGVPSGATTDHIDDASAAHAASAISVADAGTVFTATDVEGVLAELEARIALLEA